MMETENISKRFKSSSSSAGIAADSYPSIQPGSNVRLVNLPAHPGLEGVVATVMSIEEDNFVQVEVRKTKVIKKVRSIFSSVLHHSIG